MPNVYLEEWVANNYPDSDLIWKESAVNQFKTFRQLGEAIEWTPCVEGYHTSKSCKLPVICFDFLDKLKIYIRDNYYDANIAVVSDIPLDLKYDYIYIPRDYDWYLEEINRKQDYCWKNWTEEEINDPRISRVENVRSDGSKYWSSDASIEKKQRWIDRYKDTSWWSKDWSSGSLIVEGELGPGCKIYVASTAFQEGIGKAAKDYEYYHFPLYDKEINNKEFCIRVHNSYDDMIRVVKLIYNSYYERVR